MSRDGLLPALFGRVHPRFRTPHLSTLITGAVVAVAAGLLPLTTLSHLVSMGTLLAFTLVCVGIIILRRTAPDLERPFRTPWMPLGPYPWRGRLRGTDGWPAHRDVGAARRLVGARHGDLPFVRPTAGSGGT